MKELIFQLLVRNKVYKPPSSLTIAYKDMIELGRRNIWHGFYPNSFMDIMEYDIVLVRGYLSKLIKTTCLLMNWLWKCHCKLIYAKASEEVEIKEYQDLLDELDEALVSENYIALIKEGMINTLQVKNKLSVQ